MARIVGGITTSHIPAIGAALAKGLQDTPYWKPFFDGYAPVRRWLDEVRPDVAVVIYNDHGLSFFLDHIPTFAVGAAATYPNEDSGWGLEVLPDVHGDVELSWHLIESLVADEFDITMCQEMKVDHGFMVPLMTMCQASRNGRSGPCQSPSTPCSTQFPQPRAATSWGRRSAKPSNRTRTISAW